MKYVDYLNFLWSKDLVFNFSPLEVALYMYILKTCNASFWKSFTIPLGDPVVLQKYGISRASLDVARLRLVEAQLVTFVKGNGRGNVTHYELLPALKVQQNSTLYSQHSGNKGATNITPLRKKKPSKGVTNIAPLFPHKFVKVYPKGEHSLHLFSRNPATSAAFKVSKSKDSIVITYVITFLDAKQGKADQSKGKKGRSSGRAKNPIDPGKASSFTQCIDLYDKWVRMQTATEDSPEGMGAKIDGVQGNAMKSMITYMRSQVTFKASMRNEDIDQAEREARVVQTWKHILDNTNLLTDYLQGKTKLVEFNSEFQNIVIRVKRELQRQQQQQSAGNTSQPIPPTGNNRKSGGTVTGFQNLKRDGGTDPV